MCKNRTAARNHTLSMEHLRLLAELVARERGAELATAYAITPEGEKIDLLRPDRCARAWKKPPVGGGKEMHDALL